MANKRVNFVEQTTATTGTGSITLVAKAGFAKASDGLAVGETAEYYLESGNDREYGIGTMQAGEVFDRTTVKSTLVAGVYDDASPAAITLVGTSNFGLSPGAEDLMNKSDTSFEGALWKASSSLLGSATAGHVNLGEGCSTGTNLQSYDNITVGGGLNNVATGTGATIAGGASNDANGTHSFLGGGTLNKSWGVYAVVCGGYNNKAGNSYYATVCGGVNNTASGQYSGIFSGYNHGTSGVKSVILGGDVNTASGTYSYVGGGRGNTAGHTHAGAFGGGSFTRANYDVVFGGVDTTTSNVANNTIRLEAGAGNIKIDGAVSSPEAGIGECVEWLDGNPNNEDRTGLGVSFSSGKLIVGGDKIRGVISQTCGLISNDVPNSWHGKYLRDNFKRKLWVEYEVLNWVDEWGEEQTTYKLGGTLYSETQNPVHPTGIKTDIMPIGNIAYSTIKVRQVNPDYDHRQSKNYKARSERPEWGVVETDGQPWAMAAEEITGEFVDFNLDGKVINGTTYPVMDINGDAIQIWFKGN